MAPASALDVGEQTAYVAFDVGRMYWNHNLPHIATLIVEVIDSILPTRQIVVKAPRTIEITVFRQHAKQRTIINLADQTQSPGDISRITEIVPVHDIEVAITAPRPNPKISCRGSQISTVFEGDRLRIKVAKLDSYAAIVIAANAG